MLRDKFKRRFVTLAKSLPEDLVEHRKDRGEG
jgi:hypothetical protein